jgi:type VI secretion system protein VasI
LADIQGYGNVDIRLDADKADTYHFLASTDNKALGAWRGGQSIPLAKKMNAAKKLTMRFTPYNESRITATFDISGMEKGLKQVADACNWALE